MKAKIDKSGWLSIERAGEFRKQVCPFSPGENYCGHWCPLFSEIKSDDEKSHLVAIGCGEGIYHEIVSDERKAAA